MKTFRKTAFTLAEGATHVDICDNIRKCAFTLAEVLITLGIIGVVAAITIPPLVTNLTERINSERQANIALKFTKAMENMKALGLLHEYESTDAFVDELQNHIKIAKRCSASNIADCWPTSKVIDTDGEEYDVSKAKKGKDLHLSGNTTDNVGLVLDDGAAVILTYNQNSEGMDVTDPVEIRTTTTLPVGFGKTKEFAYTNSVTTDIDFVMDVNGAKGPNSETVNNKMHDIRPFNIAKFGIACSNIKIPGIGCIKVLNNYSGWELQANFSSLCGNTDMQIADIGTLERLRAVKSKYPDKIPQSGQFFSPNCNTPYCKALDFGNNESSFSWRHYNYRSGIICIAP